MDKLTPEQRHRCMASIKGKDTKPEMLVRKFLWRRGFRYRLNHPRLPGKPDIDGEVPGPGLADHRLGAKPLLPKHGVWTIVAYYSVNAANCQLSERNGHKFLNISNVPITKTAIGILENISNISI